MKGPRRLKIEALRSDLLSVIKMIERADRHHDAIGAYQFSQRREAIEAQLEELGRAGDHIGKVALFFGGGPVLGSRGVEADFAGEALNAFQGLIQKKFAIEDQGEIGARGPVARQVASQLLVTDVARGSFGFFLEEAAVDEAFADTALKVVIDQTNNLIANVADPSSEVFETAIGGVDSRVLLSLKSFFSILDTGHATVRLVDDDHEFLLDRVDISRARQRVEATEIQEDETTDVVGTLFFLPQHRTFELLREDTGETVFGRVEPSVIRQLIAAQAAGEPARRWRAILKIRRVQQRGQDEKTYYRLSGIIEP